MAIGEREFLPSSLFAWLKGDPVTREGVSLWSFVYNHPEAIRELIADGMKNRSPSSQEDKSDLIEVTKDLKDAILNLYSMKSKYSYKSKLGLIQQQKSDLIIYSRNPQFWM